jgi:hypothetical protein
MPKGEPVRLPSGRDDRVTASPFGPSKELVAAFAEVVADDAELVTATIRPRREKRPDVSSWSSFKDAVRSGQSLLVWWRSWRKTAAFRGFVTFLLLYGLLAVVRKPSDAVVEQSRHAEELAALQEFFKSYCAAGGVVLGEKPHGGSELYPRGVVLQGDLLAAFRRAAVGETFAVQIIDPAWNPISAFYGYPPIFGGGTYFHLERKFKLSIYRFHFLIMKDTEQSGRMLLGKVELAF